MKYRLLTVLILLFVLQACSDNSSKPNTNEEQTKRQDSSNDTNSQKSNNKASIVEKSDSVVTDSNTSKEKNAGIVYKKEGEDILLDSETFPDFPHPVVKKIMAGMRMCRLSKDTIKNDSVSLPPCKHQLYRVFKFKKGLDWEKGFIVEAKSNVYNYSRMVIVIKKVNGKYSAVNQFSGELLELKLKESGYYDIYIAYADARVGSIAVRHEFNGNNYKPVEVEEINNHFVKEKYKDSLYDEYIKDFKWGV